MNDWRSNLQHVESPIFLDPNCANCSLDNVESALMLFDLYINEIQSAATMDLIKWICPRCKLYFFDTEEQNFG